MTIDLQQALATAAQFHQSGQLPQAEAIYRQILAHQPNHPQALHLLGILAQQVGKDDIAADLIRRSIAADPSQAQAYSSLGTILRNHCRFDEAALYFRQALSLAPNSVAAHVDLAMALRGLGDPPDEIAAILRRAILLDPNCAEAHNNLGNILLDQDKLAEAIASFEKAIAINPRLPNAYNNLGNALKDRGELEPAIKSYRQGLELAPDLAIYHSNLIYALHFLPDCDSETIALEGQKFSESHERPLATTLQRYANNRDPDRRLRVGYVSPHFYSHAESFFVAPLLESHNHDRTEVYCYSSVTKPDIVTKWLRGVANVWQDVHTLSDAQLADKIRSDNIDILVDLTMHMANNRLLMFARKPAPVQVAWLAYPGSAGLKAIDYRLSDAFLDLVESDVSWSSEQPIRLPDCWVCYDPLEAQYGVAVGVSEPPSARAGHVTFGSLNNPSKHNRRVLELWARVMKAVPGSRLLLLSKDNAGHHADVVRVFESLGVSDASGRIQFVAPCFRQLYMEQYDRIDIALDPFPYNGITTTCDALWMGVPVITLPGKTPASRAGLGLLTNLGLQNELVAGDDDDFVQRAAKLAGNGARLVELRRTLRHSMKASPLMDAKRFAVNVENAYRQIWRQWCAKAS